MPSSRTFIHLTILLALTVTISGRIFHDHADCGHRQFNDTPIKIDVDEAPLITKEEDGRTLAVASYPNIRITTDFSLLTNGSSDVKNYIQNQLMPPVIDYFQAALAVKQPLTTPLRLPSNYVSICGYKVPPVLLQGVNSSDFYLIVSTSLDNSSNWVANAGSCYLASGSNRPIIARMLFNLAYTVPANGDVLLHEKNTYLTIHEMIHAFGFTAANFANFIDASGNPLDQPVKTQVINGVSKSFLDVEPLTSNLRKFYGCSSLLGAPLEDDGGAGTAGSHFERRTFLYDVMTSGVLTGYRVSSFSFNVLEGSGWYVPNYDYAEPFYFGQGEGCNFINQDCSASSFSFDEFCRPSGPLRGCTANGRGGGVCATDSKTNGCYYMYPMTDYDCDDVDSSANARLASQEAYGRGVGSKCFSGTLTTQTKASQTSFCFKYNCTGSGLSTQLQVNVGSTTVTCTAAGPLTVKGYNGVINCPDPLAFCNTAGKKYCPRNCMGRGKCVNNKCVCNQGASGIDCGVVGTWGNKI